MGDGYWQHAAENSARTRRRRLQALLHHRAEWTGARNSVERIAGLSDGLGPQDGPAFPDIEVARSALYRTDGVVPGIPRLVSRQGEALRHFLVMALVEHVITQGTTPIEQLPDVSHRPAAGIPSWPTLLAYPTELSARAVGLRLRRSLSALETAGLVVLGERGATGRFRAATLRQLPRQQTTRVRLPISFFSNGWHLVLTPSEIALYLALRVARDVHRRRATDTVFIPRTQRLQLFHLSDEIYAAHSELAEFGLLETFDPESGRKRGRIAPRSDRVVLPYEFRLVTRGLRENAFDSVAAALQRTENAPRHGVSVWGTVSRVHRTDAQDGELLELSPRDEKDVRATRDEYHRQAEDTETLF